MAFNDHNGFMDFEIIDCRPMTLSEIANIKTRLCIDMDRIHELSGFKIIQVKRGDEMREFTPDEFLAALDRAMDE